MSAEEVKDMRRA